MTFTKEQVQTLPNFNTLYRLKAFHEDKGFYFFSQDTMRFFKSRIHSDVYGGCVFVTSERQYGRRRYFTVRYIDARGNIETVGEFQGFDTRSKAHTFAKNLGEKIDNMR